MRGEKLAAALPIDAPRAIQVQIKFMNQRGGLKPMSGSLFFEYRRRQMAQFRIPGESNA
jgi:hypothetical protein